jgi:CheY-like chemotaxis protein
MKVEQISLRVLWLEDNEDDVFFMMDALKRSGAPLTLRHVWNGKEALDVLASRQEPLPDAILTDIRMPFMDGLAFTREIRNDPAFESLPVLILSTSGLSRDVQVGLDLGASAYFIKPNSPAGWCTRLNDIYHEILRQIESRRALCNSATDPVAAEHAS